MDRPDAGAVEEGLALISGNIIKLLDEQNFDENEQKKLSTVLFSHMNVVFNLALNRRDENACIKSVSAVQAIGEESSEKFWIIVNESAQFLGREGKKAAEIKEPWLDDIILNIVLAFTSIGGKSADKSSKTVAVTSLNLLGSIADSSIDRSNLIEIIEDGLNSIAKS